MRLDPLSQISTQLKFVHNLIYSASKARAQMQRVSAEECMRVCDVLTVMRSTAARQRMWRLAVQGRHSPTLIGRVC
jgi:hypothetical protein